MNERRSLFALLPELIKDLICYYVHLDQINRLNTEYKCKIRIYEGHNSHSYITLFYNTELKFQGIRTPEHYCNMRNLNKYFPLLTKFNLYITYYQMPHYSDIESYCLPRNYYYTGISRHSALLYLTRNLNPKVKEQIQRYVNNE